MTTVSVLSTHILRGMNKNILHSKAWSTVCFSEACVQLKVAQSFKTDEWMDVKEFILLLSVNFAQYAFQPFTHSFHLTQSSAYIESSKHNWAWNKIQRTDDRIHFNLKGKSFKIKVGRSDHHQHRERLRSTAPEEKCTSKKYSGSNPHIQGELKLCVVVWFFDNVPVLLLISVSYSPLWLNLKPADKGGGRGGAPDWSDPLAACRLRIQECELLIYPSHGKMQCFWMSFPPGPPVTNWPTCEKFFCHDSGSCCRRSADISLSAHVNLISIP